jgi:uncharacterized protein with PQ loop repeat
MGHFWDTVGVLAGVFMPVWNLPLIVRIVRRKTSQDISLAWLWGVELCTLLMLPSALRSHELLLKAFGISNALFFSGVVIAVLRYRQSPK